jgi:hypothetical protein
VKTSLDLPDDLYRRVKSKSALEGLAVREVAAALFSAWVDGRLPADLAHEPSTDAEAGIADPRQQWHDRWRELAARVSATSAEPGALVDQLRNDRR